MTKQTIRRPKPRKLDDTMIQVFYEAVLKVHSFPDACALSNLSYQGFQNWQNQAMLDEQAGMTTEDSIFLRFVEACKKARAENKAKMLDVIRETAEVGKQWLPAAWFLERTDPDNFGRRERHDFSIESKTINITRVEIVLPPGSAGEIIEGEVRELPPGESRNE